MSIKGYWSKPHKYKSLRQSKEPNSFVRIPGTFWFKLKWQKAGMKIGQVRSLIWLWPRVGIGVVMLQIEKKLVWALILFLFLFAAPDEKISQKCAVMNYHIRKNFILSWSFSFQHLNGLSSDDKCNIDVYAPNTSVYC